ncbi:biofilm development regulator YmgB/AriR family protein [Duffyella gerundensis]|uniref:biofilm development regulator YmgB/AriR family protein n=1 Tax=Duffyella TaxID=3026546 RepID=UPI003F6E24A4
MSMQTTTDEQLRQYMAQSEQTANPQTTIESLKSEMIASGITVSNKALLAIVIERLETESDPIRQSVLRDTLELLLMKP